MLHSFPGPRLKVVANTKHVMNVSLSTSFPTALEVQVRLAFTISDNSADDHLSQLGAICL